VFINHFLFNTDKCFYIVLIKMTSHNNPYGSSESLFTRMYKHDQF